MAKELKISRDSLLLALPKLRMHSEPQPRWKDAYTSYASSTHSYLQSSDKQLYDVIWRSALLAASRRDWRRVANSFPALASNFKTNPYGVWRIALSVAVNCIREGNTELIEVEKIIGHFLSKQLLLKDLLCLDSVSMVLPSEDIKVLDGFSGMTQSRTLRGQRKCNQAERQHVDQCMQLYRALISYRQAFSGAVPLRESLDKLLQCSDSLIEIWLEPFVDLTLKMYGNNAAIQAVQRVLKRLPNNIAVLSTLHRLITASPTFMDSDLELLVLREICELSPDQNAAVDLCHLLLANETANDGLSSDDDLSSETTCEVLDIVMAFLDFPDNGMNSDAWTILATLLQRLTPNNRRLSLEVVENIWDAWKFRRVAWKATLFSLPPQEPNSKDEALTMADKAVISPYFFKPDEVRYHQAVWQVLEEAGYKSVAENISVRLMECETSVSVFRSSLRKIEKRRNKEERCSREKNRQLQATPNKHNSEDLMEERPISKRALDIREHNSKTGKKRKRLSDLTEETVRHNKNKRPRKEIKIEFCVDK